MPAQALTRFRCTACGNLTRFDVTTTRRTRAFHHFTLGGEVSVEDEQVLTESVDDVSCRWCGTGAAVEVLPAGELGQGAHDDSAHHDSAERRAESGDPG